MAGKVFHVSDDIHAQTKSFCDEYRIQTKQWVEGVVTQALKLGIKNPVEMTAGRPEPVPKKPIELPLPEKLEQTPPWERAPFWVKAVEDQDGS